MGRREAVFLFRKDPPNRSRRRKAAGLGRSSGERHQKRDRAAHVPRLDFTVQRTLGFEFSAAVVDRGAQPV